MKERKTQQNRRIHITSNSIRMKQNKALKQIKHNFQCSQQKLKHFKYRIESMVYVYVYSIASGMLFHV